MEINAKKPLVFFAKTRGSVIPKGEKPHAVI
jgi:hypothetical protein